MDASHRVTELLLAARAGDAAAYDELFPLVYDALRRIARRKLAGERSGHTLATADLVHEAYLKLVHLDRIAWQGRAHFLAIAARAMRNVLVDHALRRKAEKRGGGPARVTLDKELAVEEALGAWLNRELAQGGT
jgi:RNA polymerase sigma factor (TIGR02999 family)